MGGMEGLGCMQGRGGVLTGFGFCARGFGGGCAESPPRQSGVIGTHWGLLGGLDLGIHL